MLPTILDFEASGFGHESYPIEVGVALSDGQRFCTLIKPLQDWSHWDESAAQVHQISQHDLQRHGVPVSDVCARLNQLLRDQIVYCDGWVVDKPWLNRLYEAANTAPSFSLSPIESIQSEAQQNIWAEVKDELLESFAFDRHRASHDALLIQETYKATRHLRSK
ncbi:MAG TPA: hypothetical protein VIC26_00895 [Marinagarivorans sp.]